MHAIMLKLLYTHNDFLLVSLNHVTIRREVQYKG